MLDEGQVPDKGQGGFKARLLRRIVRAQCDEGTGAPSTRSFDVVAASEQIDLVWLMQPWSEPLPIPYIATVWDLEHRKQPYFPEVSAMGWTFSAREDVFNALLPRASMIITVTRQARTRSSTITASIRLTS